MKTSLLLPFALLAATSAAFGQDVPSEYLSFSRKADSLLKAGDNKNAALAYSSAFRTLGNKGYLHERYNAACAWALCGVPDSAFDCLDRIVRNKVLTDFKKLEAENDFTSLHNDKRWPELVELCKADHTAAQKAIAAAKADTKISVMNDRASFLFPAGSKVVKKDHPFRYTGNETDVECELGPATLHFSFTEIMSFGDKNTIANNPGPGHHSKGKIVTDRDGIVSTIHNGWSRGNMICNLKVSMPDHTLFIVSVRTNETGRELKEELNALVEQVFQSIAAGSRRPDLSKHSEVHAIAESNKSFKVNLPENYGRLFSSGRSENTDAPSTVFFVKYATQDQRRNHPEVFLSLNDVQQQYDRHQFHHAADSQTVMIKFLGQNTPFKLYKTGHGPEWIAHAEVKRDDIRPGFTARVGFMTGNESSIDELKWIIANIQLLPDQAFESQSTETALSNDLITSLSPNPAQNNVELAYTAERGKSAKAVLSNQNNVPLKSYDLEAGSNKLQMDVSSYAPGVYFVTMSIDGKNVSTKKLVIAR